MYLPGHVLGVSKRICEGRVMEQLKSGLINQLSTNRIQLQKGNFNKPCCGWRQAVKWREGPMAFCIVDELGKMACIRIRYTEEDLPLYGQSR